MKDFKSYAQGGNNNSAGAGKSGTGTAGKSGTTGQSGTGTAGGQNGDLNRTLNMAEMIAKAFNGKSEGQILQTILAQAEQGKRDGTLSNADLDNFYATVAPMRGGFEPVGS